MSEKPPPPKARPSSSPARNARIPRLDMSADGEPRMPASHPDRTSRIIARRYEIQSKLGAGGMGVVYGAIDLTTGVDVAVKVLGAAAANAQNVRRFRREVIAASAVKHRYCCEVLGAGIEGGAPYIVMERLYGETLHGRLSQTGPLCAPDAVAIMLQILEGLAAAHAVGVLHRDIKPGNVFLTTARGAPPSIKLFDFGLAKLMPSASPHAQFDDQTGITTTNVVPGTPMYLAPEQVVGQRNLDQRVDVWAAGLTLYEMLLNEHAFKGFTFDALAKNIVATAPPKMSSRRADLPAGFDRILERALAKRRDERYPTATAFRDDLLSEWARFRTAAIARGRDLQSVGIGPPLPVVAEPEPSDEATTVDLEIVFDRDDPR